ncbi:hypothetical protein DL98DRAFT_622571 [Cadophora sp. DSE1049]|nr:hypothetical protein DL98DRAFT_622571 [Cadophora sp. DSE1049]
MSLFEALVIRPLSPSHLDPRTVAGDVRRRTDRVAAEAPSSSKPKTKDPEKKLNRGSRRAGLGGADGADGDGSDSDSESWKNYGLRDDGEIQLRKSRRKTTVEPIIVPPIQSSPRDDPESPTVIARRELQYIWQGIEIRKKRCARDNPARERILVSSKIVTAAMDTESSQYQEQRIHMQKTILLDAQKAADVAKRSALSFTSSLMSVDEIDAMQELVPKVEEEVVALCMLHASARALFARIPCSLTSAARTPHDLLFHLWSRLRYERNHEADECNKIRRVIESVIPWPGEDPQYPADSTHHLNLTEPELAMNFLAGLSNIPENGHPKTRFNRLYGTYHDWLSGAIHGLRDKAVLRAEMKQKANVLAGLVFAFTTGKYCDIKLLVRTGQQILCEKQIARSDEKDFGWNPRLRYRGDTDSWFWRYRARASDGNDTYIFKEQMDGKVIGVWSPNGDIDWNSDHEKLLQHELAQADEHFDEVIEFEEGYVY